MNIWSLLQVLLNARFTQVPTESEVRRVMLAADSSGDGQLDFLEFLALVKVLKDEKKKNSSFLKSFRKMIDTVQTDVLGSIKKDLAE